ncbi:MAG: response regulator, partial [Sandaracinaceae bacterium]
MSLRILIVDDETNARRSLAISLKLAGHRVHDAADGYAALAVLESDPIDLALVDLMMPDMSGLELARQINVRHQHVRVVLVSAYHLSKRQLERMDCGAIG